MRVFIPSKGRAEIITTPRVFEGQDYFVVVHNQEERERYLASGNVPSDRLLVSNVEADAYGLTRQREWVCEKVAHRGEWFVFADDNVVEITAVQDPEYHQEHLRVEDNNQSWREIYGAHCTMDRFRTIFEEMVAKAERIHAHWLGFATNDNYRFRGKKYRTVGYVIGKMTICHNVGMIFDHAISMEDFNNTADQLLIHGRVLINNFAFPVAKHYQTGGMGTYEERIQVRLRDVRLLMRKYPNLFRIIERPGFVTGTDIRIRFTSEKQVAEWRKSMGVL